jgi:hypothetical protein
MRIELTNNEINEWFIETISDCTTEILKQDNDTIEGIILEDIEPDIRATLYDETLNKLLHNNYINGEIFEKCSELRDKYLLLKDKDKWSIDFIRNDPEWKEFFLLGDTIIDLKKEFDLKNRK